MIYDDKYENAYVKKLSWQSIVFWPTFGSGIDKKYLESPKIFVGAGGEIILVGHLFSKGGKVFASMVQPAGPKSF